MVETRYGCSRKENKGQKEVYSIDQFEWFRDGMERTFPERYDGFGKKEEKKLLSAVRFHLPYAGKNASSYLVVVGNGFDVFEAYLARVNQGMSGSLTGEIPKQESALWRLFKYNNEVGKRGKEFERGFNEPPKKTIDLAKIFSTDICPFLGWTSFDGDKTKRIYNLEIHPDEHLEIIANMARKNPAENETLEIIYVPDPRNSEPHYLTTLKEIQGFGWMSKEVEDSISTDNFTFASVS
jgi:hypothetical protein